MRSLLTGMGLLTGGLSMAYVWLATTGYKPPFSIFLAVCWALISTAYIAMAVWVHRFDRKSNT